MKKIRIKLKAPKKRLVPLTREDLKDVIKTSLQASFAEYAATLTEQLMSELNKNEKNTQDNCVNSATSVNATSDSATATTKKKHSKEKANASEKEIKPESDYDEVCHAVDYWVRLENLFPNRSFFARRNEALRSIFNEMRNDYGFVKEQTLKEYLYSRGLPSETKISYLTALLADKTWRPIFTNILAAKINNAFENAGLSEDPIIYWADEKGSEFVNEKINELYTERIWKKIQNKEGGKSKQEIIRANPAVRLKFCHLCMASN